MTAPTPTLGIRTTAFVTWAALLGGLLVFSAVAWYVEPTFRRDGAHGPAVLADVALVLAIVGVLASRLVPPRLRLPPGTEPESFAISRNIVAAALCEGPGLFGLIAWMLTGNARAALAAAIAVVALATCFPGDARWRSLLGPARAQPGRGPSRMVR